MSVVTRDEIIERIVSRMDEDNKTDEDIKLIEDLTDTFDDYEKRTQTDWKTKFEENDKMWRDKYVSRFMNKEVEVNDNQYTDSDEVLRYEDLFKEE